MFHLPVNTSEQDAFINCFIVEAIEANSLTFGGACGTDWDIFITKSRGSATETDRTVILNWLEGQPVVNNISIGPLVDAWWGW